MKKVFMAMAVVAACATTACDGEVTGEGTLAIETWGEEYIEEGIPGDEFADGFSVTYDTFLVVIGDVSAAKEGDAPALEAPAQKVWDLTETGPFQIATGTVPKGDYFHTVYTIAPPGGDVEAGNVDDGALDTMVTNGYSVYVIGTATDGTVEKSFEWGFDTSTLYDPCHSVAVVEEDGEATIQLTIHGDHLFYDDAVSEDPSLRFNDLALADADDDGEITREELEAYDITVLPNYGVGSLPIDDMWGYVSHMTTTLGHIDGEGHCEMTEQ